MTIICNNTSRVEVVCPGCGSVIVLDFGEVAPDEQPSVESGSLFCDACGIETLITIAIGAAVEMQVVS